MSDLRVNDQELIFLKQSVISTFIERNNQGFEVKSTLDSYETLENDIRAVVTDVPHVSRGLLRKLLYYTSDATTVFRSSFIDTCYRYISENKYDRYLFKLYSRKKRRDGTLKWLLVLTLVLMLVFFLIQFFKEPVPHTKANGTKNQKAYEALQKGEFLHYDKFLNNFDTMYFFESEKQYKVALHLDSNYSEAHTGLADLYLSYVAAFGRKTDYVAKISKEIDVAYRLNPKSIYLYEVKGVYHFWNKEVKEGQMAFLKAINLAPTKTIYSFSELATKQLQLGLIEDATKLIDFALTKNPSNAYFQQIKARILTEIGNLDQAKQIYLEALLINEKSQFALFGLAKTYFFENRPDLIKPILDKLIALNTKVNLNPIRAFYYGAQNEPDSVIKYFRGRPLAYLVLKDWDGYLKYFANMYSKTDYCGYPMWSTINDRDSLHTNADWLKAYETLPLHPDFPGFLKSQQERLENNRIKYGIDPAFFRRLQRDQ